MLIWVRMSDNSVEVQSLFVQVVIMESEKASDDL